MHAHRIYGPEPGEPEPLRPVPDLAGSEVEDMHGHDAGVVHGTLAEADSGLIRYLDVAVDDGRRHVLVPLGHTRVERDSRGRPHVRLLGATHDELLEIPAYRPDEQPVDEELGREVARAHGRLFHGERYYAHPAYDHHGLYAGEHPILRGPAVPKPLGPLEPLSELPDFRLAEGEPDIRGLPLFAGGQRIGTIDDLIVDTEAEKVRYAVVGLEAQGRQVLVPVGYLRIRSEAEAVDTPPLVEADLEALPTYEPGGITRPFEQSVRTTLAERLDDDGRHFRRPDYESAGNDAYARTH